MKKHYKLLITCLLVFLFTIIILSNYKTSSDIPIINYLQDLVLNVNKYFNIPKKKLHNYNTIIENNKELESEIKELKELNNIKTIISNIDYINASVIARNNIDFYNTITIDKGKKDHIKNNEAVVSGKYLIGKVIKVNNNSSIIKLVTTNDVMFNVSVYINNKIHGILSGYDKKTNNLMLSLITSPLEIKVGDIVTTSGLGEIFPSGIQIGTVEKIDLKPDGITKIVYVKAYKNYDRISFVSVLKRGEK
ncbi:MAG: rod shape-determining protein MreC [Bacilli bacterium]